MEKFVADATREAPANLAYDDGVDSSIEDAIACGLVVGDAEQINNKSLCSEQLQCSYYLFRSFQAFLTIGPN